MEDSGEKKRLLVVTSTFPRWKEDRDPPFVYQLCKGLLSDYDIRVLAPHFPGAKTEEVMDGIRVIRFRYFLPRMQRLAYDGGILAGLRKNPLKYGLIPFFIAGQLAVVMRLIRRQQFHLIHAHWLIPQGLTAVLARKITRTAVPLICTSHGGDLYGLSGRIFSRVKRWVIRQSEAVTVVSQAMRREAIRLEADSEKLDVVPMGVDLKDRFVPGKKKGGMHQLLFVGRLVEKKGVRYLIEAIPAIAERYPDVHLKIAGDGPDLNFLAGLCRKLDISGQVTFLGGVSNTALPGLYQEADILVFPSVVGRSGDREGFGLVLVEALGCECAVVSTDLPAMEDIVVDGQTGLVVPERNSGQIAEKVICLFDNPDLKKRLGKAGRQFAVRHFDWDVITEKYRKLLQSIA